jgi:hypothetical protein
VPARRSRIHPRPRASRGRSSRCNWQAILALAHAAATRQNCRDGAKAQRATAKV